VVRESLTNVLRHAAATTALITVDRHKSALSLTVTDDGSGSPGEAYESGAAGSGIAGMRGAVEEAGGTLTAGPDGSVGAGFAVRVWLPLPGRS
jgi:signal transduction histidine kinase